MAGAEPLAGSLYCLSVEAPAVFIMCSLPVSNCPLSEDMMCCYVGRVVKEEVDEAVYECREAE